MLVKPSQVGALADDITRLRDDVERAAKRMERLEQACAHVVALRTTDLPTRNLDT